MLPLSQHASSMHTSRMQAENDPETQVMMDELTDMIEDGPGQLADRWDISASEEEKQAPAKTCNEGAGRAAR
eukprot:10640402-Lingulodinium_polyedra.AAC.1